MVFDDAFRKQLLNKSKAYINYTVFDKKGKIDDVFWSAETFVNASTAPFYKISSQLSSAFVKQDLTAQNRGGLLTQGAYLAAHAPKAATGIIRRGHSISEDYLCKPIPPPPQNVQPANPTAMLPAKFTQRMRQELIHTSNASCNACHQHIDPGGVMFENFDAAGIYQSTDGGLPVDAKMTLINAGDTSGSFDNAADFFKKTSSSQRVGECYVNRLFEFQSGQAPTEAKSCMAAKLYDNFKKSDRNFAETWISLFSDKSIFTR